MIDRLFRKYPLSTYLAIAIFCILVFAVAGLVVISYVSMERTLSENARSVQLQTENNLVAVFKAKEEGLRLFEESLNKKMETAFVPFLGEYERAGGDPSRMDLAAVKHGIGDEMELYVIDANATIVATTYPPELGLRFGDYAPYFAEYLNNIRLSDGFFPDRIVSEKSTGALKKYAYVPTPDHSHVLELGLPVTMPEVTTFRYLDRDLIMEVEKANPYLTGVRVFDTTLRERSNDTSVEVSDPALKGILQQVLATRSSMDVTGKDRGTLTRYLFVDLRDTTTGSDVSRIIELSYTNLPIAKALEKALVFHVLVGVFFLSGCALVAFLTLRKFTRPIERMVGDLDQITRGDLDHPITPPLGRDLLQLQESTTRMVMQLKKTLEDVQKSEENFRNLVQGANSIIMRCTPDGKILYMNPFGLDFFGYAESEITGKKVQETVYTPPEGQVTGAEGLREGPAPFFSLSECAMQKRNGQEVWVTWTHRPLEYGREKPPEVLSIGNDISRLKQAEREIQELNTHLEQKIAERTRQIVEVNRNLESFTYSVSHDLRAPLRAISGYSSILLSELGDLPPREKRHLEQIQRNSNEMGELIDDLLTFARLGGQALKKKALDPAEVVREVLEDFRGEIQKRNVGVRVHGMPACSADRGLLRQVYYNLVANAIKFSRSRERPLVEIGALSQGGIPVYYVRDNGIGFDMRYSPKLFRVFERICDTEEYEGTGVGLAIVKRIVEMHGGRVWAESEPDKGATFLFTLGGETGEKNE
ncbi:MAG: ATP-binding protein [Methanolinea sp.]|nr:ATP-binding protein [Methanolinea sp.]